MICSLLFPGHSRRRRIRTFLAIVASSASMFCAAEALADEQNIVRARGDHPTYFFDAEPHALLGYGPFIRQAAPGVGFRGTFIIVQNGFVPTINNSVGIGVGADLFFASHGGTAVAIPVVMQWNFWLSTHWAVFGEPGVGLAFGGSHESVFPVFAAGGKYHFNERIALTIRVGYPAVSCGVSFYL